MKVQRLNNVEIKIALLFSFFFKLFFHMDAKKEAELVMALVVSLCGCNVYPDAGS